MYKCVFLCIAAALSGLDMTVKQGSSYVLGLTGATDWNATIEGPIDMTHRLSGLSHE